MRQEFRLTDIGHDQAEGLRRLLMQDSTRIVSVVSGGAGAGKTTTVINLAAFLACSGKNVLAIDENACASNICATLGLSAHRDLLDVIRRDKTLDQVLVSAPPGFQVLPAGRGMRVLDKLSTGDQTHLITCFAQIAQPIDIVLIDTAPARSSRLLQLDFAGHELLVVLAPEPASITSAYSLIKHVHGYHPDKQRFHILINKSSMEREAGIVFENMARAADQYLGLSLDFAGHIPADGKLGPGFPMTEAFADTPSAVAFRGVAESLAKWQCGDGESRMLERFIQRLLQSSHDSRPERAGAVISGLR
jgi:flagellar biosynthesis protein FlhG